MVPFLLPVCGDFVHFTMLENFCHIFLSNHAGSFLIFGPDLWYEEVYHIRQFKVGCFLLPVFQDIDYFFMFSKTLTIFSCWKISVTFFSATMQVNFLIFGTDLWFGEVYHVRQLKVGRISTFCFLSNHACKLPDIWHRLGEVYHVIVSNHGMSSSFFPIYIP